MKDKRLKFRIRTRHLELVKCVAQKVGLNVPKFVLAVLIPYCCKLDKQNEGEK